MNYLNDFEKKYKSDVNLIKSFNSWNWILRPNQTSFASTILYHKSNKKRLSDITEQDFNEFKLVVNFIEKIYSNKTSYFQLNYLALMMVDPIVHFHIIPRYSKSIFFQDLEFKDYSFPKPPDLSLYNNVTDSVKKKIIKYLKS
jgi:diadenosine tetraphosphate (Ap4A) HIT family hydrolase